MHKTALVPLEDACQLGLGRLTVRSVGFARKVYECLQERLDRVAAAQQRVNEAESSGEVLQRTRCDGITQARTSLRLNVFCCDARQPEVQ